VKSIRVLCLECGLLSVISIDFSALEHKALNHCSVWMDCRRGDSRVKASLKKSKKEVVVMILIQIFFSNTCIHLSVKLTL
jgi:hypothetical protein